MIGNDPLGKEESGYECPSPPYSLGKLIDWKHNTISLYDGDQFIAPSPYSLGKLIDWKLEHERVVIQFLCFRTPYSLGKLIDWKLDIPRDQGCFQPVSATPYSLGKLIDWKRSKDAISQFDLAELQGLPTR